MKVIWKTQLVLQPEQTVLLPRGAVVRKVAVQYSFITLWFECDPANVEDKEERFFQIVDTGHAELPDAGMKYIDSVIDRGAVWHVYERVGEEF